MELHWTSIIPPVLAIILAFITREAVISLAVACLAGVLLMGQGITGFTGLITRSLGNEDFIWICSIEFCIGVLVAFFQRSGSVGMFTAAVKNWAHNRKKVNVLAWLLGLFIFFSDYFSPLFVGPTMRNMTDKFRISREKLAYICDSTSAPLVVMVPITGWAVFLSGLAVEPLGISTEEAMSLFIHSIPFNFYAYLSVIMVFLLAINIIPDFGPMKAAEKRALETGKVLRDGAVPMMGKELTNIEVTDSPNTNIILNFFLPVLIIIVINISTFFITGTAKILESFILACTVLGVILWFQKVDNLNGIMKNVYAGMKGVMPAVVILAFAYCINTVSREMRTAEYVISITEGWLSSGLLPFLLFVLSGLISFSTGTSWGTYAIMIPIALPLAYQFSGGTIDTLVMSSFAAVAGGGVFGDHCSPLSDTTVLSSLGSACDHIDHVKTQIPYTLAVAAVVSVLYLIVGFA